MREIATTVEIDAPPSTVWRHLVDLPAHAGWNPFFASMEGDVALGERLAIRARKPDGSAGMGFRPTVVEVEEERVLRWIGHVGVRGLFDGEHSFVLTPLDGGSRTRLDHGERFTGILVPFTGRLLADTEDGFGRFNEVLAARCGADAVRS